jgi:demethylmenaquinone methyltransferase/2-methoxy-6-polyprenyl-1,4-benzoquinol methylase
MMRDAIRTKVKKALDDSSSSEDKAAPPRAAVWRMFDRIAPRYDLLNRLLSLRQDVVWRNKVARYLPDRDQQRVLDVATGTAYRLLTIFYTSDRIHSAVGIDLSPKMLQLGLKKIAARKLDDRISLMRADTQQIPFADGSFDAVTIAFGIRNVVEVPKALAEMHRVLKPGGRVLILEFSMPRNWLVRKLYPFHLRGILPCLGGMISGDHYAYRYLNKTVETFPHGEEFCDLMQQAGFVEVEAAPLAFGIATIYRGGSSGKEANQLFLTSNE